MPQTAENPVCRIRSPAGLRRLLRFCSRSVQFILHHERNHDLLFVTRFPLGKDLRRKFHLEAVESMLWISGRRSFDRVGSGTASGALFGRILGRPRHDRLGSSGDASQLGLSPYRAQSAALVIRSVHLPGSYA